MKRLVFACLIVAGMQGRAADVSRIELLPLQTVTVTEEQFLTGSRDGRPVTIAAELRLPSTAAARVPAVILLHGSGGANTRDDRWSRDLNDLGVATLLVDSFTGRGIVSTVADQSQLSELSVIIDAYRALDLLAKHPRIDATRIGLLGGSRGGDVDALREQQAIPPHVCTCRRGLRRLHVALPAVFQNLHRRRRRGGATDSALSRYG